MRGGFHLSGLLSPLDWLTLSVTAQSCGLLMSLAKEVRFEDDQVLAPDCPGVSHQDLPGSQHDDNLAELLETYNPSILQGDHMIDIDI